MTLNYYLSMAFELLRSMGVLSLMTAVVSLYLVLFFINVIRRQ